MGVEEAGADDAAAAPEGGDRAEVEPPIVLLGGGAQEVEALGEREDPRGEEGVAKVVPRRVVERASCGYRRAESLRAPSAQLPARGEGAGEHGGARGGVHHAEVEGAAGGPASGALLLGLVEHEVHERASGVVVPSPEGVHGDVEEEGIEIAPLPAREGVGDGGRFEAVRVSEQVVDFGDGLHIGVLDAVVDHLDVVARAARSEVGAAGLARRLGRHAGEDGGEVVVGVAVRPPGIMLGPSSAPFSPPETPMPTKRSPRAAASPTRRSVSVKREFPPSTRMSPGSRSGLRSAMMLSIAPPASTMSTIARGRASEATNASTVSDGTKSPSSPEFAMSLVVRSVWRL